MMMTKVSKPTELATPANVKLSNFWRWLGSSFGLSDRLIEANYIMREK